MANHYLSVSLSFGDNTAPFGDASVRAHRSHLDGDPIVAIVIGDVTIQRGGAEAGPAMAAGLRKLAEQVEAAHRDLLSREAASRADSEATGSDDG